MYPLAVYVTVMQGLFSCSHQKMHAIVSIILKILSSLSIKQVQVSTYVQYYVVLKCIQGVGYHGRRSVNFSVYICGHTHREIIIS
jgi:hypothetical protein